MRQTRLSRAAALRLGGIVGALAIAAASCAVRTMPPAPVTLAYPEFLYPAVPPEEDVELASRIEGGWRHLQSNSLGDAEREFESALRRRPDFYPAEAGLGWVELARESADDAAERFERALAQSPTYVPALVGRGRSLLELGQDEAALASFEAALIADPSLADVRSRVDVLRFRAVQDSLTRAQAASQAGRWDEARAAYERAVAASPDSSFLYRELATVEKNAGDLAAAFEHYREATRLDPGDAQAHAGLGSVLAMQGDPDGAFTAYETAHRLDASTVSDETLERARDAAMVAGLPPEYRTIESSPAVARGQLAALIGVRLEDLLATTGSRQVVVTDLRGHWAQSWILAVVRAGVMDPLPNYAFMPGDRVRRGDLAQVVSRVLGLIAARRPELAATWQNARVKVSDVQPGHLSYPAVSRAVASGVMSLEGGRFGLLRPVTGAEATAAVDRLKALARP